ncbi:FtsK/SpoIIIE domain-containing protein [Micromonospora echinofusca]|uniref:Cell division protein FtsK n=1 Tax=Micromonospora echinofusca TaxID=47858 RepID=A0ABS3VL66_MICEH|nr:FtsK/SpoIIIE domain-containing protein [Micromonospora echinofusca]MBO4205284.1 cell division protein FtsK [Micromonospora echinofusca]
MTSNNDPDDRFDWHAAEADLTTPDADVVDLDAARAARHHDDTDPTTDTVDLDGPAGRVLVDSPDAQRSPRFDLGSLRAGERRPILPAWIRSRAELCDAMRWAVGHLLHTTGYHAVRVPKYAGRLALRSPVGVWRVLSGGLRWLFDLEGEPVRQATVQRANAEEYLKLSRQRDRRVRWRGIIATTALTATIVGSVLVAFAPEWVRWASLATLVGLFGIVGRPADKPLLDTAVVVPRVAKLTSHVVVSALAVLGIAGINQAIAKQGQKAIAFTSPITRDGPGWRADIDLPAGVTAGDVIERRDRLAAGLARPLGCVWPEGRPEVHPGRLVLWVGDQDMATAKQPAWPLLKSGTVDLFRPIPFGTDPRGRNVPMDLMYTNLLIGSIPGAGKTFSLRVPLLAAALDARAELRVFELKGTGDLEPLALVATRYASGPDDDTLEEALDALRELRKECQRRAAVIKGLPKSVCPENKVTPELASRKNLGLHPLVVAIDECQELFSHPEFGKEAGELAEKVIKLGRALGIHLMLATQRPDARSLPTGVSANVGTRFCLRVMGQVENDMVLGTSSYKNGVRATMFTRRDKGMGYLVGAADDAQITRTYYVDGPAAERVCQRGRALREAAGTLSGHAAGQQTASPAAVRRDSLLDDILTVVPAGEPKVWAETLVERLAELNGEIYGDLTRDQLTAALKPYGITTGQVWGTDPTTGKGANRRGIERQHIADAVAERNKHRGDKAA